MCNYPTEPDISHLSEIILLSLVSFSWAHYYDVGPDIIQLCLTASVCVWHHLAVPQTIHECLIASIQLCSKSSMSVWHHPAVLLISSCTWRHFPDPDIILLSLMSSSCAQHHSALYDNIRLGLPSFCCAWHHPSVTDTIYLCMISCGCVWHHFDMQEIIQLFLTSFFFNWYQLACLILQTNFYFVDWGLVLKIANA